MNSRTIPRQRAATADPNVSATTGTCRSGERSNSGSSNDIDAPPGSDEAAPHTDDALCDERSVLALTMSPGKNHAQLGPVPTGIKGPRAAHSGAGLLDCSQAACRQMKTCDPAWRFGDELDALERIYFTSVAHRRCRPAANETVLGLRRGPKKAIMAVAASILTAISIC